MRFPDTHWSMIRRAGGGEAGRQALNQVLARYLPVLHRYLTGHRRMTAADADDLLHGFVIDKILEQRLMERADPARGRFRSLLLSTLENYRTSRHRAANAARRSPGPGGHQPIEAADDVPAGDDPSAGFDAVWAQGVIAAAVEAMRVECARVGQAAIWSVFDERLLRPARDGVEPTGYDALVRRLGLGSTTEAQNRLGTAKRMFRRHLEAVIAQYAADPRDAEAELRDLLAIVGGTA